MMVNRIQLLEEEIVLLFSQKEREFVAEAIKAWDLSGQGKFRQFLRCYVCRKWEDLYRRN